MRLYIKKLTFVGKINYSQALNCLKLESSPTKISPIKRASENEPKENSNISKFLTPSTINVRYSLKYDNTIRPSTAKLNNDTCKAAQNKEVGSPTKTRDSTLKKTDSSCRFSRPNVGNTDQNCSTPIKKDAKACNGRENTNKGSSLVYRSFQVEEKSEKKKMDHSASEFRYKAAEDNLLHYLQLKYGIKESEKRYWGFNNDPLPQNTAPYTSQDIRLNRISSNINVKA